MKLSDLRKSFEANPDQLFATCDWNMVKLVGPVTDRWQQSWDKQSRAVFKLPEETDPWAKCGDTQRPRPGSTGVLVEVFRYDKDGAQVESRGRMLVKTKDIGGPWGEFLVLHAEEVRLRGEKYEAGDLASESSKALDARVEEIELAWPVGEVQTKRSDDREFSRESYLSSTISSNYGQVYLHRVDDKDRSKIKTKPEGFAIPYWHPSLSVSANNEADVEYLLQVLEEGTKAVAKKAARRSAKQASSEA